MLPTESIFNFAKIIFQYMLKSLLIKNYALIKHLEIKPEAGLNIITGETGAGKSIMLGAMGLLMGNRADVKALFDENEKCVVEGVFDVKTLDIQAFFEENALDYEDSCLIRREISPAGKSRAFVNDSPVTLDILKSLGVFLMDIHSQHDTYLLGSNTFQLSLVDSFAQNQQLLESYKDSYQSFIVCEKKFQEVKKNAQELKKEFDYNSFLLEELKSAHLNKEEQAELEQELLELENAEELKRKLSLAFEYLNNSEQSVLSLLKEANSSLGSIANISEKYKNLKERVNSTVIEIQDIVSEIESTESKIETNENRLIIVRDKLNLIFNLQGKHGVKSVTELIGIREDLTKKVEKVGNLELELANLEKQTDLTLNIANNLAKKLSHSRAIVIGLFVKNILGVLKELGMPDAQLIMKQNDKVLGSDGADEVQLEFSANKGSATKLLKEVASGGEFSRLMLALKYILAQKRALPTIIFDEIDTGISGEVALKVGKILTEMSEKLQVIAITHLHQIAGKGKTHFFVFKDNSEAKTISLIRKLNNDERILEVAKMIGGQSPSESAIASAIEMLEIKV